jgi:hypothetical protein
MDWDDGLKALADLLPAVGEYAVKLGTRVLLEPLNKGEAKFMNRLEQAVEICKAAKSPGICLMGDFYHMCKEEKDDEQAFITAGGYIHHVHTLPAAPAGCPVWTTCGSPTSRSAVSSRASRASRKSGTRTIAAWNATPRATRRTRAARWSRSRSPSPF